MLLLYIPGNSQEEKFISISMYNFTRMVDWPSSLSNKDFYIDVIGHKAVFEKLKEIANGRKAGNRNIVVRYLESSSALSSCDMLFIGFYQSKEIAKIIEKIGRTSTLIIGEKSGLTDNGAGINFVIRDDIIRFEIKPSNIQKYGLKLSDDLVKLACKVY